MTLREHIAKALMQSRIGLTRKELTEKIDTAEYNGNADRISDQLFHMQKANHVEKSGGFNNAASRWAITSKGRAYYSDLNDDETTEISETTPKVETKRSAQAENNSNQTQIQKPVIKKQAEETLLEPIFNTEILEIINPEQMETVTYDPFKDIYNQLQTAQDMLKRIPTAPRIQHKQEKLATLRLVQQSIGLFNGDVEDILQQIYQDIDQMEAA